MTTYFKSISLLLVGATMMFSCQQTEEQIADSGQPEARATRAYGDKSPKIQVYVETNDVNPLNAGDYYMDGKPFVDIVEFFAANIRKETVGGQVRPTLYLNDKMTNLMENNGYLTYIKPLQDKGIKVLLTILGDHQGIGFCNLNDTQAMQFATILAHAVEKYGLDGIGFDDEYADYSYPLVNGSFGNLIIKLRALMPAGKLITVFEYGGVDSSQINATAGAMIDYAYTNFGSSSGSFIQGVTKSHYGPQSINLGYGYSAADLVRYGDNAFDAADGGYGALMNFNIRRTNYISPLPVFNALADGAFGSSVVLNPTDGGNRPQNWVFVPAGYTMTYAEATAN